MTLVTSATNTMNSRTSLIPTSTEAGYGSTPASANASKTPATTRSRVVAAVAGVCGVVGVVALCASGVASATLGEGITFDKVLSAQVRSVAMRPQTRAGRIRSSDDFAWEIRRRARVARARVSSARKHEPRLHELREAHANETDHPPRTRRAYRGAREPRSRRNPAPENKT